MAKMTKSQVERLTMVWQRRLKLENWRVAVRWRDQEYTYAATEWEDMYDEATIEYNDRKLREVDDPATWERLVIHELLHLHDRDRVEMFKLIEDHLSPQMFELFKKTIYQQTEAQIDRLASIFYELVHAD